MQQEAPYRAPIPPSGPADLDIECASTPKVAKVGGGMVLFGGALLVLMALQALFSVEIYGLMAFSPYLVLALGAVLAPLGLSIFRGSGWAPVPAVIVSSVAFCVSSFWLVWTFMNGFFTLFALMAPFFMIVAIVLSVVAVGPCKRVSAARARLAAAGLGFGL
jgi:hypothetical protein